MGNYLCPCFSDSDNVFPETDHEDGDVLSNRKLNPRHVNEFWTKAITRIRIVNKWKKIPRIRKSDNNDTGFFRKFNFFRNRVKIIQVCVCKIQLNFILIAKNKVFH